MRSVKNIIIQSTERQKLIAGATFLLLFLLQYIVQGQEVYVRIHDNLDSNLVWYKILLESEKLFAPNEAIIEQMMSGLPRSSYPSEWSVTVLLFWIFGPFKSFVIERFITCGIAYLGMFKLLKILFKSLTKQEEFLLTGVAVCFALLPFWPYGGLSVAGIPLLACAFFQLTKNTKRVWAWLYIFLFPFYSSLVLVGVFVLLIAGIILLANSIQKSKSWKKLGLALGVLVISYVFTHYRLFQAFLLPTDYMSHRVEFKPIKLLNFWEAFKKSFEIAFLGQSHSEFGSNIVFLLFIILGLYIALTRAAKKNPS